MDRKWLQAWRDLHVSLGREKKRREESVKVVSMNKNGLNEDNRKEIVDIFKRGKVDS